MAAGHIARGLFNRLQTVISASASPSTTTNTNSTSSYPVSIDGVEDWRTTMDRRTFDRNTRRLNKIIKLCQRPKMNLKNNPPYMIDIACQIQHHILTILHEHNQDMDKLNDIDFLILYIGNLMKKTKYTINLFKSGKEKMFDTSSVYRETFSKMSLIFSHILAELKAIFPSGRYCIDDYRIVNTGACQFWKESFHARAIVPWAAFREAFERIHGCLTETESLSLKSTMDLTMNEHISIFEFDVFTRLFQPWSTIIHNWKLLAIAHPGYSAFLTYDDAIKALHPHRNKPGSYIFRLSCTRLGQWAIAYVDSNYNVIQTIPNNKPLRQALIDGYEDGIYLYPAGCDENPDLTVDADVTSEQHLSVTREQFDLYVSMGSTFELCKICISRNKDVCIEPCGHLICDECLRSWQSKGGRECPFCRHTIEGWQKVVIEPFKLPILGDSYSASRSNAINAGVSSSEEINFEQNDSYCEHNGATAFPVGQKERHSNIIEHPLVAEDNQPIQENGSDSDYETLHVSTYPETYKQGSESCSSIGGDDYMFRDVTNAQQNENEFQATSWLTLQHHQEAESNGLVSPRYEPNPFEEFSNDVNQTSAENAPISASSTAISNAFGDFNSARDTSRQETEVPTSIDSRSYPNSASNFNGSDLHTNNDTGSGFNQDPDSYHPMPPEHDGFNTLQSNINTTNCSLSYQRLERNNVEGAMNPPMQSIYEYDNDCLNPISTINPKNYTNDWKDRRIITELLQILISQGFDEADAERALKIAKNDLEIAYCILTYYVPNNL